MRHGAWALWLGVMLSACAIAPTPESDIRAINPNSSALLQPDVAVAWAVRHQQAIDPDSAPPSRWVDPERAAKARQAWTQAVAARQALGVWQTHQEASQLTLELARRSLDAGHLSAADLARVQIQSLDAAEQLRQAQTQVALSALKLKQVLGQPPAGTAWQLPDQLPPMPELPQLSRLWDRVSERSPLALQASAIELKAAHAAAHMALTERLPLARLRLDEALLRYNGMLISVFDLLAARQAVAEAELQAIQAQRDLAVLTDELRAQLPIRP